MDSTTVVATEKRKERALLLFHVSMDFLSAYVKFVGKAVKPEPAASAAALADAAASHMATQKKNTTQHMAQYARPISPPFFRPFEK